MDEGRRSVESLGKCARAFRGALECSESLRTCGNFPGRFRAHSRRFTLYCALYTPHLPRHLGFAVCRLPHLILGAGTLTSSNTRWKNYGGTCWSKKKNLTGESDDEDDGERSDALLPFCIYFEPLRILGRRVRQEKKQVSKSVKKKKSVAKLREKQEMEARERDESLKAISKADIDLIKDEIAELRAERGRDKEEISKLGIEANRLRHRLCAAQQGGGGGGGGEGRALR